MKGSSTVHSGCREPSVAARWYPDGLKLTPELFPERPYGLVGETGSFPLQKVRRGRTSAPAKGVALKGGQLEWYRGGLRLSSLSGDGGRFRLCRYCVDIVSIYGVFETRC